MSEREKTLGERMRADWNRRVTHDYRYWMSDGYRSDQEMWSSGERDLPLLLEGLPDTTQKTALEIGCGVGRLLRCASRRFQYVIGVDVANEAIDKARELLGPLPNVALHVGNGFDLSMVDSGSVDVVYSFASLTSTPTQVIAGYMREMHRVLRSDGVVRLQVYLGKSQVVHATNTLHLRCFERGNFTDAARAAGLCVKSVEELKLPFQVSAPELGISAVVVSLSRENVQPKETILIAETLLPGGETQEFSTDNSPESPLSVDIESWMSLKYAQEMLQAGNIDKARETLRYALDNCVGATDEVTELVKELSRQLETAESSPVSEHRLFGESTKFLEPNMRALREKFPAVAQRLENHPNFTPGIEAKQTPDGAVLFEDGQCLDHAEKPVSAGEAWARRTLAERRIEAADAIAVLGFGAGYHVEALLRSTTKAVKIIEPRAEVLWRALASRDLTRCISKLSGLAIGDDGASCLADDTELVIRPQTQLVAGELCATLRAAAYGTRGLAALQPSIAVLGPLQGGTLPMTHYVARSLSELKSRLKVWDVSGFAGGYHHLEDFITDRTRRNSMQSNYVEMLSQMVLESASEKPIDILICMAQAPISGRVLEELRKKGVITVLWFVEDYKRFGYWREMSRYYDFVFTIQKGECLTKIQEAGAGHTHYLPAGCDPMVHAPVSLSAEERARWGSPVSFLGAGYHNRQQVFASLAHLPFKIWGTEWPTCKPFDKMVQEQGRRLSPGEYVKIFGASDINLNLHSSSERDGVDPFGDFVNPRTFELAAAGAFQLVDQRSLLPELFDTKSELVTFATAAEMRDQIAYYLDKPEQRTRFVEAARKRALTDHTYTQRIKEMLKVIYTHKFEQLKNRQESSGWGKLLARAEQHPELKTRCKTAFTRGEEPNLDGLVADIVAGEGKMTATEQKLMFLYHIRKQIIRMKAEEAGEKK